MPPTPPPVEPAPRTPAGLWPRTVAWGVDAGVVGLITLCVSMGLPGGRWQALAGRWQALGTTMGRWMREAAERGDDPFAMLTALYAAEGPIRPAIHGVVASLHAWLWPPLLVFVLLGALYWPALERGEKSATLGKRLLGLEARDARGARLSWPRALARHVAGALSWLSLNIGHLLAASSPGHRALHDRVAGTQVVWRAAPRKVPAWGWLLVVIEMLLPLAVAGAAVAALSSAMQAALLG